MTSPTEKKEAKAAGEPEPESKPAEPEPESKPAEPEAESKPEPESKPAEPEPESKPAEPEAESKPEPASRPAESKPELEPAGVEAPGAAKAKTATAMRSLAATPGFVARLVIGSSLVLAGAGATFLLMANDDHVAHGTLWGILCLLAATSGLLVLLDALTGVVSDPIHFASTAFGRLPGEPVWAAPQTAVPIALCVLVGGGVLFGITGLPWVIAVALAALVPPALKRPGLLVFVVSSLVLLPLLGVYGLWDPWETHYGEVSREILSRDDWISLWWAQENWFWSKPILIFWSEALSMGALGVDFRPDANPAFPEWALRLPIYLMSTGALMSVYAATRKAFGARAGVLCALVLVTMPFYALITHQAITDMPFVAPMTIALCLLILAFNEDPDRQVRSYRLGPIVLSARHAVVAAIFLIAMPQILYLLSRNVTWMHNGFAWHLDEFMLGSAGNPESLVPGNSAPRDLEPYMSGFVDQPAMQGLFWLLGLAGLMVMLVRERRARALYMFGFYVFCGLSFMGKGIPGFALPGLIALLFLVASGRWSVLLAGHLRVAAGALTVAVVSLPWYVAMYIRHGPAFTDRLLIHDHINRLASGVHGDTGSAEYFIEQLGYGMFPWVALVPAALVIWLWTERNAAGGDEAARRERDTLRFVGVWFAAAFFLFNAMMTKFHHYIFPVVPPAAIMVGLLLDRVLGDSSSRKSWERIVGTVLAVAAPAMLVLGVAGLWGDVRGLIPAEVAQADRADWVLGHPWGTAPCLALMLLGLALAAGAFVLLRPKGEPTAPGVPGNAAVAITFAAATVLLAFVARDISWVTDARPQGHERLIQLFIYNYGRPWPDELDYRPIMTAFGIVATLACAGMVFRAARPVAGRAMIGVALLFTVWSLDVYMIDLSPHWGQREIIKRYYAERASPDERLVAWQMNWKGENFYSGNRVAVFVDLDNRKIREWIQQHRGERAFFLLEHGRLSGLRGLVSGEVREVTTKRDCNKFVLVEAVM